MKRKDVVKYTFSLAVACVVVYFCFRGVSWDGFLEGCRNCSWWYIVAAMLVGCVSYVVRALRWRMLLPGSEFVDTFNAVNIGNVSNFVIPRIGEVVKCGIVARRNPALGLDKALGTMVLERSIDVLCLVGLLEVTLATCRDEFVAFMDGPVLEGMAAYGVFLWIAIALIAVCGIVFFCIKLPQKTSCGRLYSFVYGLHEGVRDCFKIKGKWLFLLYTVLLWGCFFAMSYLTIRAFPAQASLGAADALFLCLVGSFGWAIPTPGGVGSYHAIIALAFSQIYGLSWETGIIFATISHESQSLTMILCGLGSYAWDLVRGE